MPKSVIEFLEQGRAAAIAGDDELPVNALEDASVTNALLASDLLEEAYNALPVERAARIYAYDQALIKARAQAEGTEVASSPTVGSNDTGKTATS